jgi:hypothetical protein
VKNFNRINKVLKVYNAYNHFNFYENPKCGDKLCELPIVEIGTVEHKKEEIEKKPKILITAGLNGKDVVSISTAINFLKYVDENCMGNPKIHKLTHNYRIFVVPMVSPELVFNGTEKENVFRDTYSGGKDLTGVSTSKHVRMDFGVLNQGTVDKKNPVCFETNSSLFLLQLMQRNVFVSVIDLSDGDENKIVYPFGYVPPADSDADSESIRLLQDIAAQSDSGNQQPSDDSAVNGQDLAGDEAEPDTAQTGGTLPNTASNDSSDVSQEENSDSTNTESAQNNESSSNKPPTESTTDSAPNSSTGNNPRPSNDKPSEENHDWHLNTIQWDNFEENWDTISHQLNENLSKAYFMKDRSNDDNLYQAITQILINVSNTDSKREELSPFTGGISKEQASVNKDNQHIFNMFIDFAYSGSFNFNNIPLRCATDQANIYLANAQIVDSSYRALAFGVILKRPANLGNINGEYWGDQSSILYHLNKHRKKSFSVMDELMVQDKKYNFGKTQQQKDPVLDTFDKGVDGVSSRFAVMVHALADILQPSIEVDSITYNQDVDVETHNQPDVGESDPEIYVKSITGNLNLSLIVSGCMNGVEIWTQNGYQINPFSYEYVEEQHQYIFDGLLPISEFNNPYSPSSKTAESDSSPEPNSEAKEIPLSLKLNKDVNNLLSVNLVIMCKSLGFEDQKLLKYLPQSHFGRALIDPGYYVNNSLSKEMQYRAPNQVTQLTIQDIVKLEKEQIIAQTNLWEIEIISDFDIYMEIIDSKFLNRINFLLDQNENVQFENGDKSKFISKQISKKIKLLSYSVQEKSIIFHPNLHALCKQWKVNITSFADIGHNTTNTIGKTFMTILSKDFKTEGYYRGLDTSAEMTAFVENNKMMDPYGLMFNSIKGSGVHLQYDISLGIPKSIKIKMDQNRFLQQETTTTKQEIKSKIEESLDYEVSHISSFGFLYSLKPTQTTTNGYMCSDRKDYYLEIIPFPNPNRSDFQNETIGNMFFRVNLYINSKGVYHLSVENQVVTKLYLKEEIKTGKKTAYHYSTVINPHLVHSSTNKLTKPQQGENLELLNEFEEQSNLKLTNLWSLLNGRNVSLNQISFGNEEFIYGGQIFSCKLRKKNPYFEEKYSLMFHYSPVMQESGYTSNKFIL